jgi:transcriptional regulator with XRE-family HTH domain
MTQADFACCIGVSQSYLSAIEHGRNEVGTEVLLAIGREFDKSLEWLLTGEELVRLPSVLNRECRARWG